MREIQTPLDGLIPPRDAIGAGGAYGYEPEPAGLGDPEHDAFIAPWRRGAREALRGLNG